MKSDHSLSCYIIGNGFHAVKCGNILIEKKFKIEGVITSNLDIQKWACENNIPYIDPISNYYDVIKGKPFDYLFSINYLFLIPKEVLELPQKMAINFHDSILPSYAGIHATSWAIINNEKQHGITWHIMTDKVDEGEILKQKIVNISETETAFTLNIKCFKACVTAFEELLDELILGTYTKTQQNLINRSYYPKYKRPENGCIISWKSSAESIYSLVRALNFGQHDNRVGVPLVYINSRYYIVTALRILENSNQLPGTITKIEGNFIAIATGTKDVAITKMFDFDGKIQDINLIINELNLKVGSELLEIKPELGKMITHYYNMLAKTEDYWVEKIAKQNPSILPIMNYAENRKFKDFEVISRTITSELLGFKDNRNEDFTSYFEAQSTIFILFIIYCFNIEHFCISIEHPEISNKIIDIMGLFSTYVPFLIDLKGCEDNNKVIEIINSEFKNIKHNITFTRSIWHRYPILHQKAFKEKILPFPIHISCSKVNKCNIDGLIVCIPKDEKNIYFLFNSNVFEYDDIDNFINRYIDFADRN
ncbi:MAG: formyltransferase family protein [Bacillota bacterium]|nr:formyltransferase family protein [Bacillota bacterium]